MARKDRLTERNNQVRKRFYELQRKNPKWRIDAVIEDVASEFFLANRTVDAIISYEGIYNDNSSNIKKTNQTALFQ